MWIKWLYLLSIAAAIIFGVDVKVREVDLHAFQNEAGDYEYSAYPWGISSEEFFDGQIGEWTSLGASTPGYDVYVWSERAWISGEEAGVLARFMDDQLCELNWNFFPAEPNEALLNKLQDTLTEFYGEPDDIKVYESPVSTAYVWRSGETYIWLNNLGRVSLNISNEAMYGNNQETEASVVERNIEPSIPAFPGTEWNMSQEEVMEALGLSEEDVIYDDYGFTVEELPCYETTAKARFAFSTFIGTKQGLSEIHVGFLEDPDMEKIEAILTEDYGDPDPELYQLEIYSGSQNMRGEEQPEDIILRSDFLETDEHLKIWLGPYKNLNDYMSAEELQQLRDMYYTFSNCPDEMWEEFTAGEAPAQARLSDLGFFYHNDEEDDYVEEAKVLRLIGFYAAAADAIREWNQ